MIQAIAIDDEPLALEILTRFCNRFNEVELVSTFESAKLALEFLANREVELIFLDVQMPGMDGITFYNELKSKPRLIFTTAHPDFAVHGFNLGAVDYLLKPFSFDRFERAVNRAIEQRSKHEEGQEELILRLNYGLHRVALNAITLIESFGDYAHIHLNNADPIEARITLKRLEKQLPQNRFARVHRSYIVPLDRIKTVRSRTIILANREIPLGKSYANPLEKKKGN